MKKQSALPYLVAALLGCLWFYRTATPAEALSNPIVDGKNTRVVVTATPQRIPATGQKCNVVISNLETTTKMFPVYSGFRNTDGGIDLTTTGQPICDNSVAGFTGCVGTMVSRDYVPDSIWVKTGTGATPDGGVPVRVEMGTGCQ